MISFACPKCGHLVRIGAEAAGKQVKCPECGHSARVPKSFGRKVSDEKPMVRPCPQCQSPLRLIRALDEQRIRCSACQSIFIASIGSGTVSLTKASESSGRAGKPKGRAATPDPTEGGVSTRGTGEGAPQERGRGKASRGSSRRKAVGSPEGCVGPAPRRQVRASPRGQPRVGEAAEWYYSRAGEQYGPLRESTMRELARSGRLYPDDLVWKTGAPAWVRAGAVQGLFAPAAGSRVAGPPPIPQTPRPVVGARLAQSPEQSDSSESYRPMPSGVAMASTLLIVIGFLGTAVLGIALFLAGIDPAVRALDATMPFDTKVVTLLAGLGMLALLCGFIVLEATSHLKQAGALAKVRGMLAILASLTLLTLGAPLIVAVVDLALMAKDLPPTAWYVKPVALLAALLALVCDFAWFEATWNFSKSGGVAISSVIWIIIVFLGLLVFGTAVIVYPDLLQKAERVPAMPFDDRLTVLLAGLPGILCAFLAFQCATGLKQGHRIPPTVAAILLLPVVPVGTVLAILILVGIYGGESSEWLSWRRMRYSKYGEYY